MMIGTNPNLTLIDKDGPLQEKTQHWQLDGDTQKEYYDEEGKNDAFIILD